jgi:hypothetical protein
MMGKLLKLEGDICLLQQRISALELREAPSADAQRQTADGTAGTGQRPPNPCSEASCWLPLGHLGLHVVKLKPRQRIRQHQKLDYYGGRPIWEDCSPDCKRKGERHRTVEVVDETS